MDYELAKQLEAAGFPQGPIKDVPSGHFKEGNVESDETGVITTNSVYIPSLEELTEACGEDFDYLVHTGEAWRACVANVVEHGSTPTEAVARLWLALQEK